MYFFIRQLWFMFKLRSIQSRTGMQILSFSCWNYYSRSPTLDTVKRIVWISISLQSIIRRDTNNKNHKIIFQQPKERENSNEKYSIMARGKQKTTKLRFIHKNVAPIHNKRIYGYLNRTSMENGTVVVREILLSRLLFNCIS